MVGSRGAGGCIRLQAVQSKLTLSQREKPGAWPGFFVFKAGLGSQLHHQGDNSNQEAEDTEYPAYDAQAS